MKNRNANPEVRGNKMKNQGTGYTEGRRIYTFTPKLAEIHNAVFLAILCDKLDLRAK